MRSKIISLFQLAAASSVACFSAAAAFAPVNAFAEGAPRTVPVQSTLSVAAATNAATQCGNSANADIVIMIDRTGSISDSDLTSEKNAAKTLLNFFNTAAIKPHVAIGSFDVAAGGSHPYPGTSARIQGNGGLTDTYGDNGAGTGLFGAINAISNSNKGNTDISAAISVAQAHLTVAGTSPSKYVILISDGVTNRPSGNDADNCSGGIPGSSAIAAADAAETAGTKIFAIHFGNDGTCPNGTGVAFLSTQIATSTALYFEGNADLSGVLSQISQSIACDDQDVCTSDSCDTGANQCVSTLVDQTDSDNDGTTDCYDLCPSDANKIAAGSCGCGVADSDSDGDGKVDCTDQCPSDPAKIAPGQCGCGVSDTGDSDADGFADCVDQCPLDVTKASPGACGCGIPDIQAGGGGQFTCLCQSTDVTNEIGALAIGPEELAAYGKKSYATLVKNATKTNKELGKRLKKSAKNIEKKMAAFVALCNQNLDQLPNSILTCSATPKCASVDNTIRIFTYKGGVAKLANLIIHTLNRATRLVYPSTKVARKKTAVFVKTIRKSRELLDAKADSYPKTQSVCSGN